jgi:hypothetical protein
MRPKYEIRVCSEHGQRSDEETWCCHAKRVPGGGIRQCMRETEWIPVEPVFAAGPLRWEGSE